MLESGWRLMLSFHWPHDRLCLGFQTIKPQQGAEYWTLTFFLLIATLDLDFNDPWNRVYPTKEEQEG